MFFSRRKEKESFVRGYITALESQEMLRDEDLGFLLLYLPLDKKIMYELAVSGKHLKLSGVWGELESLVKKKLEKEGFDESLTFRIFLNFEDADITSQRLVEFDFDEEKRIPFDYESPEYDNFIERESEALRRANEIYKEPF
jgi:hypothetical protein